MSNLSGVDWECESLRIQKILGDLLGQRPPMIVGMDESTGYQFWEAESDSWNTKQIPNKSLGSLCLTWMRRS